MDELPSSPPPAPRGGRSERRFLALFLALIWPSGAGHLVIGYRRRAWAWAGAVAGFLLVASLATVLSGSGRFLMAGLAGMLAFHVLSAIDVARLERSQPLPDAFPFLLNLGLLIAVMSTVMFGMRKTLVEAFQIPAGSMYPSLLIGDHIFVNKRVGQYARGDVVVFDYPLDPHISYVKRVVGLPGDTIEMSAGQLKINGQSVVRRELDEPCDAYSGDRCKLYEESFEGRTWRIAETVGLTRDVPETKVPPRKYFMLGDNRENSSDSRVWGFVDQAYMTGKAMSIWMSRRHGKIDTSRFNLPVR